MAKKKVEAESKPQVEEEMEKVNLDEDEELETVPGTDIEVKESEPEVEETQEAEPEEKKVDPSASAIMEGFSLLREELRARGEQPISVPQEKKESEEDFDKLINDELFKENPAGILKKAINREARKLVEAEVGPIVGTLMETAFENAEFRLKNDAEEGPIYRKFEEEIKRTLRTLTTAQQKNPQVLKAVFERVKSLHVNEIIDMKVEEKLKERKPAAAAKKPIAEGASTVTGNNGARREVLLPKRELEEIKKRAGQLGIDYRELVARRAAK